MAPGKPAPSATPIPGRYGALLIVLVASYLLSAFINAHWIEALQVVLFTLRCCWRCGILRFRAGRYAS